MSLVACRDVSVDHGEGAARVHALRGVDLEIAERESLVLRGPSGSGKTTLLHLLGGLVTPTSGVVEWEGRPLAPLDASARTQLRRDSIAYVFQGGNLLPNLTVFENVAFALALRPNGHDPAAARALIERVGLGAKADSLPAE